MLKHGSALVWSWLSLLIVVFDQVSKQWADAALQLYRPVELLPGLNFTLSYNSGAAFSFLSDAGGWQRWLFTVLAVAVSLFILRWMHTLRRDERWMAVALALILGGALGNVWDRIVLGHVIDFIDVYYQQWHWPTFNVADSAICVGAVMLVVDALRNRDEKNEEGPSRER